MSYICQLQNWSYFSNNLSLIFFRQKGQTIWVINLKRLFTIFFRKFYEYTLERPEPWPTSQSRTASARSWRMKKFTIRYLWNNPPTKTGRVIRGRDITDEFFSPGFKMLTISGRKLRFGNFFSNKINFFCCSLTHNFSY